MTKIFIGGFPLEMTEMELVEMLAPYADIITIKLVRDRATKKCKGYGFVEVSDDAQAKNVVNALNGVTVGDRVLTLNIVTEQPTLKPTTHHRKAERSAPSGPAKRPPRPRIS